MAVLTLAELTQTTLEGTGVFDTLMRANKAHLEAEFSKGRIKGTEYATVYLGSLETVMRASLEFLLQKDKNDLEARLLEQQILLAQVKVQQANAELAILQANLTKIPAEIAQLTAQTALTTQQKINAEATLLNIPKEGLVLDGQKCKLDAEFDLIKSSNLKAVAETTLLTQKNVTEKAQTLALGVDDNSVIGKQKSLYQAQTEGFKRDAEQKAAAIMVGTWNARRMTNDETVHDGVNKLGDSYVGSAVSKLLGGVGA